jgi:hypothetical protein
MIHQIRGKRGFSEKPSINDAIHRLVCFQMKNVFLFSFSSFEGTGRNFRPECNDVLGLSRPADVYLRHRFVLCRWEKESNVFGLPWPVVVVLVLLIIGWNVLIRAGRLFVNPPPMCSAKTDKTLVTCSSTRRTTRWVVRNARMRPFPVAPVPSHEYSYFWPAKRATHTQRPAVSAEIFITNSRDEHRSCIPDRQAAILFALPRSCFLTSNFNVITMYRMF